MMAVTVFGSAYGIVEDQAGTTRYCASDLAYDRLHALSNATVTIGVTNDSKLVIRDGVMTVFGKYTYYGIYYTSYAQKLCSGNKFAQGMTIVAVNGDMTLEDLDRVKRQVLYHDPSADRLYEVLNEKYTSVLSIYST